jgi:hypothetical protein
MDYPRRRALLALLAGGASLAGLLREAGAQAQIARNPGLYLAQGDVRVNGKPAKPGELVRAGDAVTTGRGGLAVFSIGQDAFLMRENSRANLAGQGLVIDALRLLSGKLLGVFVTGHSVRINTPTATIGIRGTGAYLEAEAARTYFCLCYGSAEIASANGTMRDAYTTTHHESPRYIYNDGRRNTIVSARVINHTDSELIMLESLVGRTPPPAFMASPDRY